LPFPSYAQGQGREDRMSIVEEVLEREIGERMDRLGAVKVDLESVIKRIADLGSLSKQIGFEILELNDALKLERDHVERVE
jgi:hypothetical protein